MHVGVFDLFKIGIGPSSSHTVGPMAAALAFTRRLRDSGKLERTARVQVELFGSLAYTGVGHGTQTALLLGLEGDHPAEIDPDTIPARLEVIRNNKRLSLGGEHAMDFDDETDILARKGERLDYHSNAMRFTAFDEAGEALDGEDYYSVGGGFIVSGAEVAAGEAEEPPQLDVPYPYESGEELLEICAREGLTIAALARANEVALHPEDEVRDRLRAIWRAMDDCIERGLREDGILPGGLNVQRRAPAMARKLGSAPPSNTDPLIAMDWVNLWAMAVNEENAAGGRVVTAPTNGAAGIIPAVMKFYDRYYRDPDDWEGIETFLLVAGAIGALYKKNASISGAEAGCQGEVGTACSMAAAGLCAALHGSNEQVENAAEIAMEHNLGLTCDPVKGLVQIPCIERNAMGAVKAIDACRLALHGDGTHRVSLDQVIKTMWDTGRDMMEKYKETSEGGLAVNVPDC